MDITWLKILGHDLIGLVLLGLISEIWSHRVELQRFEQRWARFVIRQRQQQSRLVSKGLPGLGQRPGCKECQVKGVVREEPVSPPPWVPSKRGRREIKPTWQFCPAEGCWHYGWSAGVRQLEVERASK